jgi:GntR family transcriptional regulator
VSDDKPQYALIRERLLEVIAKRRASGADTRLFTEQEIAQRFKVHRLTARHAIQSLVADGLVYRLRGRGTFLAPSKLTEPLDRITNFLAEWPSQGHGVQTRLLRRQMVPNPGHMPGLPRANWADLLYFVRLRIVREAPVAVDHRWVRPDLAALFGEDRLVSTPIQEILKTAPDAQPVGTEIEIEAVAAEIEEAALLKTLVGSPLLLSRVREKRADGIVLVVGHSFHRPDLFKYKVTLPPR